MRTDPNPIRDALDVDPFYDRARRYGVRTVPLVRSPPVAPWWSLAKVAGVGIFGVVALAFVCAAIWGG